MDQFFMEIVHALCVYAGFIFTPFFYFFTFIGNKCWFFLLIAFFMCFIKKTRWIGVSAIFAILFCYLFGDVLLKPLIMRPRPFQSSSNVYYEYWQLAGSFFKDEYSMPSGHMSGTVAFFTSLYICSKKEVRKPILVIAIIVSICMALSRMYFMHHYFTDCLVGAIIGFVMAFIAKFISIKIHNFCKGFEDVPFFNFILNFDILKK